MKRTLSSLKEIWMSEISRKYLKNVSKTKKERKKRRRREKKERERTWDPS